MDINTTVNTNFINNYFNKVIKYFYGNNNLIPKNNFEKYIKNYDKYKKFEKLPILYTNPIWDSNKKKLVWKSFDQELQMAKKRSFLYNNYYTYKYFYTFTHI